MRRRLCDGHEVGGPVWQIRGIRNTVALGSPTNPAILQLIERFGLSRRLVVGADNGFYIGCRSVLVFRPMDDAYEDMLCHGPNRRRACMLGRLDDVGADVRLRGRFANLADEDVNPTKGDPVPVFD